MNIEEWLFWSKVVLAVLVALLIAVSVVYLVRRHCPQCRETISRRAKRCPHCGTDLA